MEAKSAASRPGNRRLARGRPAPGNRRENAGRADHADCGGRAGRARANLSEIWRAQRADKTANRGERPQESEYSAGARREPDGAALLRARQKEVSRG